MKRKASLAIVLVVAILLAVMHPAWATTAGGTTIPYYEGFEGGLDGWGSSGSYSYDDSATASAPTYAPAAFAGNDVLNCADENAATSGNNSGWCKYPSLTTTATGTYSFSAEVWVKSGTTVNLYQTYAAASPYADIALVECGSNTSSISMPSTTGAWTEITGTVTCAGSSPSLSMILAGGGASAAGTAQPISYDELNVVAGSTPVTPGGAAAPAANSYNGPSSTEESGFFGSLEGDLTGGLSSLGNSILGGLSSVTSAVTGIGSSIVNSVTGVFNELGNLINDIVGFIEQALQYLFIPTTSTNPLGQIQSLIQNKAPFSIIEGALGGIPAAIQGVQGGASSPQCPSQGGTGLQAAYNVCGAVSDVPSSTASTVRTILLFIITILFIYGLYRTVGQLLNH